MRRVSGTRWTWTAESRVQNETWRAAAADGGCGGGTQRAKENMRREQWPQAYERRQARGPALVPDMAVGKFPAGWLSPISNAYLAGVSACSSAFRFPLLPLRRISQNHNQPVTDCVIVPLACLRNSPQALSCPLRCNDHQHAPLQTGPLKRLTE